MKKTLMSVVMASVLMTGSAFAAPVIDDTSEATLKFHGKVTSSLCQINTNDLTKDIALPEVSSSALTANNQGPSTQFNVELVNCDSTVQTINYRITDTNNQGGGAKYLLPTQTDTTAKEVGVFLLTGENAAIEPGVDYDIEAEQMVAGTGAMSTQTIPLIAYIGKKDATSQNAVTAGTVDAVAIMTIKPSA